MKVVVDTNIWISFLIGKYFVDFYDILVGQEVDILSTKKQVEEILRVIDKPKLRKYFRLEEKEFILHLIERTAEFVEIEKKVNSSLRP